MAEAGPSAVGLSQARLRRDLIGQRRGVIGEPSEVVVAQQGWSNPTLVPEFRSIMVISDMEKCCRGSSHVGSGLGPNPAWFGLVRQWLWGLVRVIVIGCWWLISTPTRLDLFGKTLGRSGKGVAEVGSVRIRPGDGGCPRKRKQDIDESERKVFHQESKNSV
ncbi:hypothetical protein AKJ16_DCAP16816 [Drosera capensis]